MARLPVSIIVPTASVLTLMVAIGAYIFIGERLTASKLSAIGMIAVGVVWLGLRVDDSR
jgi:drug/metabolite transporter (DMT)-like permease